MFALIGIVTVIALFTGGRIYYNAKMKAAKKDPPEPRHDVGED